MNTALRHWREAATVILAAGTRHAPSGECLRAAPSRIPHTSAFDYEVLLLKRSGKSGFMPNAYVFPGGTVDSSDFSSEWQDVFKSFLKAPNYGVGVVRQPPETRPPIFATDRVKLGSPIPGDVAFRICAVRETFEESGVLLVVPKCEESSISLNTGTVHANDSGTQPAITRLSSPWDKDVLSKWRSLVINNPANFIKMCRELQCLPNIWALHEWGNWLTPTGVYGRRYDTAFYICCLQETPYTLQDEKEIIHFKWSTPSEVLHRYKSREIWIAPPQLYDLGRMCRFPSLMELHHFACQRSLEGCEQWLPINLMSDNGNIFILPGDDLYPENVESSEMHDGTLITDKSLKELQRDSSDLHRIISLDPYTVSLHMNISPKYNHLPPLSMQAVDGDFKTSSKL